MASSEIKYLQDEKVRQLIQVKYQGGSNAVVKLLTKISCDGHNDKCTTSWKSVFSCNGYVGKNGLGKTMEGDGKTPTGDFGILTAFGIKDNPGTRLPYIKIGENTYCCDSTSSVFYNKIVEICGKKIYDHADHVKGEHMIEFSPQYNYGLFIDYNRECVPGLGSAIFMHCFGDKHYTEGCIAIDEESMKKILCTVDCNARIVIDY